MTGNGANRTSSARRAIAISLAVALPLVSLHWVLLLAGAPRSVRLVVDLIVIIGCGAVTVNFFRVLLRNSQEEAKENPKPW